MDAITKRGLASLWIILSWKSDAVRHTDRFFIRKVNFWRDILPAVVYDSLLGKSAGQTVRLTSADCTIVPPYDLESVLDLESTSFDRRHIPGKIMEPRVGRFYPRGILRGLAGVFRSNTEPCRCAGIGEGQVRFDCNHPLSAHHVALEIRVADVRPKVGELGGSVADWVSVATDGPGMQARWRNVPTDFFSDEPFRRTDEQDDARFYGTDRFVNHIDDSAIETVTDIYRGVIRPGMRVLDLMSSWDSHIPGEIELSSLVGLGLNEAELKANRRLTGFVLHDVNKEQPLPFEDSAFDAAVCTVSVDYMTRPVETFREVGRVLRPGGDFIVTFSNRWFPDKVVKVWTDLHEFERVGLVTEYFLRSGIFSDIETFSQRGLPRPENDKYFPQMRVSDPIYAVRGKAKKC